MSSRLHRKAFHVRYFYIWWPLHIPFIAVVDLLLDPLRSQRNLGSPSGKVPCPCSTESYAQLDQGDNHSDTLNSLLIMFSHRIPSRTLQRHTCCSQMEPYRTRTLVGLLSRRQAQERRLLFGVRSDWPSMISPVIHSIRRARLTVTDAISREQKGDLLRRSNIRRVPTKEASKLTEATTKKKTTGPKSRSAGQE